MTAECLASFAPQCTLTVSSSCVIALAMAVGHQDRRAVGGVQREQLHPGLHFRRLRVERMHVLGADWLDIGDPAAAQDGERLFRHDGAIFHLVSGSVTHGPRLLSFR
jgi:hypothetical protein